MNRTQATAPKHAIQFAVAASFENAPSRGNKVVQFAANFNELLTRIQGDPQEMSEGMRRGVVEGFEYQCELWKSIELSAKAGRVIRTPGLSQFERPHSSITSSYAAQESSMLNAAATGRPYVSEDGHKNVIDAPTAERIQTRFSEVLRRFDRLLDPKWRD